MKHKAIIILYMHVCVYFIHMSFFLLKVSFIMFINEMHISYCISMPMKIEGKANLQIYFWFFLCRWHARWKSSYNLGMITIPWDNITLHFICIWLALLLRFLFSLFFFYYYCFVVVFFCVFFICLLLLFCLFVFLCWVVSAVRDTVNITDSAIFMEVMMWS